MSEIRLDLIGAIETNDLRGFLTVLEDMQGSTQNFKKGIQEAFKTANNSASSASTTLEKYLKATDNLIIKENQLLDALKKVKTQIDENNDPNQVDRLQSAYNLLSKDLDKVSKQLDENKKKVENLGKSGQKVDKVAGSFSKIIDASKQVDTRINSFEELFDLVVDFGKEQIELNKAEEESIDITNKQSGALSGLSGAITGLGIGLLISGITLAIKKGLEFIRTYDGLTDGQRSFNEAILEGSQAITEETTEVEALSAIINDNTASREQQKAALEDLQEIMPELVNLNLDEAGALDILNAATQKYTENLIIRAQTEALLEKIADKKNEQLEVENSLVQDNVKWYDVLFESVKGVGNTANTANNILIKGEERRTEAVQKLEDEIGFLEDQYNSLLKTQLESDAERDQVVEKEREIAEKQKELAKQRERDVKKQQEDDLKAQEQFNAEQEKLRDKLYKDLEKLEQENRRREIASLEGEERINAEEQFQLEQLRVQEESLKAQLEQLELAEDEKLALKQALANEFTQKELQIIADADEKRKDFQEAQNQEELQLTRELELAKAGAAIDIREDSFQEEAEFEAYKQNELNKIRLRFLREDLASLGENLDEEGELTKLKLEETIRDLEGSIEGFQQNEGSFSIASALGLTDGQLDLVNEGLGQLVESLSASTDAALESNQSLIDSLTDRIDAQEEAVSREQELADEGKANSLKLERERLADLQSERNKAIKEQEKLQKRQAQIQLAQQTGSLLTAAAQTFAANSTPPFGVGLLLATGYIASMFSAFKAYKAQVNQEIKLKKGASGDYLGIIKGNRHERQGERFTDHIEVEDGEGWGVLNRSATAKHGDKFHKIVRLMNDDRFNFDSPEVRKLFSPSHSFSPVREAKLLNENIILTDNRGLINKVEELTDQVKYLTDVIENKEDYVPHSEGQVIKRFRKGRVVGSLKTKG